MNSIPEEYIDRMPSVVDATKESCQAAADATLVVMFLIGAQVEGQSWPPIISNGVENWPLPAPWASDEERMVYLLGNLNGTTNETGLLAHTKRNAVAFNDAIAVEAIPEAEVIAKQMPNDSGELWSYLNALAARVEDENVYRTIVLSAETHGAYNVACGVRGDA